MADPINPAVLGSLPPLSISSLSLERPECSRLLCELATTHRARVTCIWCAGERWRHGEVCPGYVYPSFLRLSVKLSIYSFFSSGWLLPCAHLFHPVPRWAGTWHPCRGPAAPRACLPARPPSPGSSELLPGHLQQSWPFCGLGTDRHSHVAHATQGGSLSPSASVDEPTLPQLDDVFNT